MLAAPSEDQLTKWLQALCEAAIGQEVVGCDPTHTPHTHTSPGHLPHMPPTHPPTHTSPGHHPHTTHPHTTQTSPGHLRTCLNCALVLTQNMLHILVEDWTTDSVQLVTSCRVTDLNGLCVDSTLPLYCTVVCYIPLVCVLPYYPTLTGV